MKNCKIILVIFLIFSACILMAESVTYTPAVKVRAAVVEPDSSYYGSQPQTYVFQWLNDNRNILIGKTSFDTNMSFYNPRGNKDNSPADYWTLNCNDVTENMLNQYDVICFNDGSNAVRKRISEWMQKGGIVILCDINQYLPGIGIYKGSVSGNALNNSATQYNFPYSSGLLTSPSGNKGLSLTDFPGFNLFVSSAFKSAGGVNPMCVVKVGAGKLIYADPDYFNADANVSLQNTANLLFEAFSENKSNESQALRPSMLGESLLLTESYHGDKPLVVGNSVYYVQNDKFYVNGFDLTMNVNGTVPSSNLSRPEHMGDGDFVMYDKEGNLYLCSIAFDGNKNINSNDVTWFKLYESENSCNETIDYAPLVYNYWAYFIDDSGSLNCINTKELDNGKAKYSWTTKGATSLNSVCKAAPCISSRIDMYGSYVTDISWITLNDTSASVYSYMLCTVPIAVINEEPRRQPVNMEPYNQIIPNYVGFPNITGNNTFRLFDDGDSTPDIVFCQLGLDTFTGNGSCFLPYTENNTSKWDYKINHRTNDAKRNGYIYLNTKTVDGKVVFDDTVNYADVKGFSPADYRFTLSYVPKYTQALRSPLIFGKGMFDVKQELLPSNSGVVYTTKLVNNTDSENNLTFINKNDISENKRQGTFNQYPKWSFLPHAGFFNTLSPVSESQKIEVLSYIDWGFPTFTYGSFPIVYVNGMTSKDGDVYASLTAEAGNSMWKRSAIVCLDGKGEPEIHLVDGNRNPVRLKYMQKKKDGSEKEANFTAKIYQPSVYDTELAYSDTLFSVTPSDYEKGIVKINNMNLFNKGGKTQLITSSLPVFIQLEWIPDLNAPTVEHAFIPVFPGTSPTLDAYSFNNTLGSVSIPVSNGTKNIDTNVYEDLENWNIVKWYSVLPGNTTLSGNPVVSNDKVMVLGSEEDEYGQNKQNKSFTIVLKGNVNDGVKVREDSIKVANLSNDANLSNLQVSANPLGVAVANGTNVYTINNTKTLVIDNNVLEEIDPAGNISWRLSTVEYNDGTGIDYNFGLENPVRAKYVFDNNHIAVADAGIKTVMVIDKTGKLKSQNVGEDNGNWWKFTGFEDPYGLLRAGSSMELGFISDFLYWTENDGDIDYNHFMIADSTNKRLLDLVIETNENGNIINNAFDDNGNVIPYLNWICYDTVSGKKNNYVSIDITEQVIDCNGNTMRAVVAGVANYNTAERNGVRRAKGGSVVIYDYRMGIDNIAGTNKEDHSARFGRVYDTIGKQGDNIFDENVSDNVMPYISGLKKVAIANLDGRNFDSGDIKNYTDLEVILCDEFGANLYKINSQQNYNGLVYYYWSYDTERLVSSRYFGYENPTADQAVISDHTGLARFKPFSSNYYNRVPNGDTFYRTTYAPLKAPIIPMDVKVLDNGNWLILNGYSGNVKYNYKNPYDGLIYEIEGKYAGEALEIAFNTYNGITYPNVVWTSNNIKSYTIDDYVNVTSYTDEQLGNWNRVLDSMDIRVYCTDSAYPSPIGYENNIVGGASYQNKTLKSPRSLDR